MEAEKELEKLERTSTRMYRQVPTGGFETLKSGKMKPEDYFDVGVIAGRNEKPESTDDPEKKTA